MEKKKVVPIWLSVVFMIFCIGALVNSIFLFKESLVIGGLYVMIPAVDMLPYILAILYGITGYKKSSYGFFLAFCIVCAVVPLMKIYGLVLGNMGNIVDLTVSLLAFGIMSIFTVAKNLGKMKSYVLAGLNLLGTVISFCHMSITMGIVGIAGVLSTIGKLILAVIFGIMVYAKYQDKAARGTK